MRSAALHLVGNQGAIKTTRIVPLPTREWLLERAIHPRRVTMVLREWQGEIERAAHRVHGLPRIGPGSHKDALQCGGSVIQFSFAKTQPRDDDVGIGRLPWAELA